MAAYVLFEYFLIDITVSLFINVTKLDVSSVKISNNQVSIVHFLYVLLCHLWTKHKHDIVHLFILSYNGNVGFLWSFLIFYFCPNMDEHLNHND